MVWAARLHWEVPNAAPFVGEQGLMHRGARGSSSGAISAIVDPFSLVLPYYDDLKL